MDINGYTPQNKVSSQSLLSVKELTQNDIFELLYAARNLKLKVKYGETLQKLRGKNSLLLAKNSNGRSRIAFEIASRSISVNPIVFPLQGSRIDEILADDLSFKVMASYGISSIVVATEESSDSEIVAKCTNLPVINANDNDVCFALSAALTAWEKFGNLSKLKVAFIGDVNGKDFSVAAAFSKCGAELSIIAPQEAQPTNDLLGYFGQFGGAIWHDNLNTGMKNCDIIYVCGHSFDDEFLLTDEAVSLICPNAKIMQAVPLERGKQAEDSLLNGQNSLVLAYGENVLHILRSAIYLYSI